MKADFLEVRRTKFILIAKALIGGMLLVFNFFLSLSGIIEGFWLTMIPFTLILSWLAIATMRWALEYYKLQPKELEHRDGILFIDREIILLKNVEKIKLSQSILGRFLNYGTIKLYAPTIKQEFELKAIGNPEPFLKAIEQAVNNQKSELEIIKS